MLFGVKVYTKHQGYQHTYTIKKFSHMSAASCKFTIEKDGNKYETTVKDYFRDNYNISLKYPDAPLMETAKKTYVPIELLSVKPNQRYNHLLSPFQTSNMIRVRLAGARHA